MLGRGPADLALRGHDCAVDALVSGTPLSCFGPLPTLNQDPRRGLAFCPGALRASAVGELGG
eukprot:5375114-Pyramimonas_sp.AAC.1